MLCSDKQRLALGFAIGILLVLPLACADKREPQRVAVAPAALQDSHEPEDESVREIELSDAKMAFRDPSIVTLEVKYRFTKGRPQKEYQVEIAFPGTSNAGIKPMQSHELRKEGVIKDAFRLSQPGAKSFEIVITEAPTPRDQFKKISNVATGVIQ